MVAIAAPLMPQPNTKIKIGANTQLRMTVPKVAYIAFCGRLVERNMAFRPKYMCVTTLPIKIIDIKLRA